MPLLWLSGATSLHRLPDRERMIVLSCFEYILHTFQMQIIDAHAQQLRLDEDAVIAVLQ